MAGPTPSTIMAENTEALQLEIEALKAEKAALAAKAAELTESLEAATSGAITIAKIPGKATVTLETPEGKKEKKTVGFRPGRKNVRLGNGAVVPSASFLKVVNGEKLTNEELASNEHLRTLKQDEAIERLTFLVTVGANILEDRK